MFISYENQLRFLDNDRFEELCTRIIKHYHPKAYRPDGKGGDKGIDIYNGIINLDIRKKQNASLHVWQVKYFNYRLGTSQRKQIIKSLDSVIENLSPNFWTLCISFNLTINEHEWFEEIKNKYEEEIPNLKITKIWDSSEIVKLSTEAELLNYYFLTSNKIAHSKPFQKILNRLDTFEYLPLLFDSRLNFSKADSSNFYNGFIPTWNDIFADYDAHRNICEEIWREFIKSKSIKEAGGNIDVAILVGGPMSGKTTTLMRLGKELVDSDFHVFWQKIDKPLNADMILENAEEIFKDRVQNNISLYILIDGLGYIETEAIEAFITRLMQFSMPVIIIATSLSVLWNRRKRCLDNIARVQEFNIDEMTEEDLYEFLVKYSQNSSTKLKEIEHLSIDKQYDYVAKKSKNQLGVMLIELKHNLKFEWYVLKEYKRVVKSSGDIVRKAILYVCAFHRFDIGIPISLLKKLLSSEEIYESVLKPCEGFLLFDVDKLTVSSRHAKFSQIIFSSEVDLNVSNIYENILSKIASDEVEDRIFRTVLKRMINSGEKNYTIKLLSKQSEIENPILLYTLADLYLQDNELENAKKYMSKALGKDPENVINYLKCAQIEAELDNLGNIDERGSARWYFFNALSKPDEHPSIVYHQWGRIEEMFGNIGFADASEEYSARWLYRQATKLEPDFPHAWVSWALLEYNKKNIGIAKEKIKRGKRPIYTARYILWKACQNPKAHPSIWRTWAIKEDEINNFGKNKNDLFTAKWLYSQLLRVDFNNSISWRGAAVLEHKTCNTGSSINDRDTARWMFWKGHLANPRDVETLHAWAQIEESQDHYGAENNPEPYTARWLYRKAVEVDPMMKYSWTSWAYLEEKLNNLGNEDTEYSARYLYKKATEIDCENPIIFSRWAQLEKSSYNYEFASNLFAKAAEVQKHLKSKSRNYSDAAAMAFKAQNDELRIKNLKLSLNAHEENSFTHRAMGQYYSSKSNWNKADYHFQRALEIEKNMK